MPVLVLHKEQEGVEVGEPCRGLAADCSPGDELGNDDVGVGGVLVVEINCNE